MTGVRHVALFRWRPGVTHEQVAELEQALAALPTRIPQIADYRFGPDLGVSDGNFDFAVVADFANRDDFVAYRDHPDHRFVLVEVLAPLLEMRAAVQLAV